MHRCVLKVENIMMCLPLQISDAFRRFGMGDKDTSVLLVQIHSRGQGTLSHVAEHVQGEMVNLSRLQQLNDVNRIKKVSFGDNCLVFIWFYCY